MGSPDVSTQSSVDPALQKILSGTVAPRLNDLFSNPIAATGPRQILGETGQESGLRNTALSGLLTGAGFNPDQLQAFLSNGGANFNGSGVQAPNAYSPVEQGAVGLLGKTLNGDFLDPTKSPIYQTIADSIRRQAMESAGAAGDQLNANFAGAGHLGASGPLLNARTNLARQTGLGVSDQLASFLMPLYQQQLGYQQNAIPQAAQFGDIYRNAPLRQLDLINQAYALSGVPRNIQQQQLDEMYQYQQRQRAAQLEPYQLFTSLLGSTPQASNIVTPDAFSRIGLPILTSAIGAAGTAAGGLLGRKPAGG